jgi:hypothetical protein
MMSFRIISTGIQAAPPPNRYGPTKATTDKVVAHSSGLKRFASIVRSSEVLNPSLRIKMSLALIQVKANLGQVSESTS